MFGKLTVRRGNRFLFSRGVAVFPTEEAAKNAKESFGKTYGKAIPTDVDFVIGCIRSDLRSKGIDFLEPKEG